MELGKQIVSAFLDLSKAFETLEHSVIFRKFEKYGLCGPCLEWFKSYLSGRTLKVRCNTSNGVGLSKEYDVTYGAPQGSCLGPLIFLVFCNNLHLHLMYLEVLQFADDTMLYLSHKHIGYLRNIMSVGSSSETLVKSHKYNTRRKGELNSPRATSIGYRKSFLIKGLLDFSSLPQSIKSSTTLKQFVKQCKNYLIN